MTYKFIWSPTGQTLGSVKAQSYTKARAWFRAMFPSYARYMGEVRWEVAA